MQTTTIKNPRKTAAALKATRVRVQRARNRRWSKVLAEIRAAGFGVRVTDHDGEVSFDAGDQ